MRAINNGSAMILRGSGEKTINFEDYIKWDIIIRQKEIIRNNNLSFLLLGK